MQPHAVHADFATAGFKCAQSIVESEDSACPICENVITKRSDTYHALLALLHLLLVLLKAPIVTICLRQACLTRAGMAPIALELKLPSMLQ